MAFESELHKQLKELNSKLPADRISSLPDELLINILNFLPTKSAFITSTLSRRWSHLFKEVNNLDFDDSLMFKGRSAFTYEKTGVAFSAFVGNMMNCIKLSNLTRFRINCSGKGQCFDGKVESWLPAILSHGILEIDLCLDAIINLPNTIFTCKTLCVLKLTNSDVLRLPQTVCLSCLKILHLKNVMVLEQCCTDKIIPGCPLLHDFCMESYPFEETGQLSISAPSLRKLKLKYNKKFFNEPRPLVAIVAPLLQYFHYGDTLAKSYSITTSGYLVEAHLGVTRITFEDVSAISHSARELIQAVSKVKRLFLSAHCMEAMTYVKDDLPILSRLTKLELGRSTILHVTLPMLLEIAPCLEELIFKEGLFPLGVKDNDIVRQDYWGGHENVPSCLKTQLKIIEIKHFSGFKEELRMVEYFLSNSHSLAQVTIHKWIGIKQRSKVIKQLKMMVRRWNKCVHFCDRPL